MDRVCGVELQGVLILVSPGFPDGDIDDRLRVFPFGDRCERHEDTDSGIGTRRPFDAD